MRKIEKILVTTDFSDTSDTAFPLAADLAEKFGARIVVLHAMDVQLPPLVYETSGMGTGQLEEQRLDLAKSRLEAVREKLGAEIDTVVVSGIPHVEIVEYADSHAIDLIVMATHGRGFFSHAILGSTTERVVRRASCPVLTIKDPDLKH